MLAVAISLPCHFHFHYFLRFHFIRCFDFAFMHYFAAASAAALHRPCSPYRFRCPPPCASFRLLMPVQDFEMRENAHASAMLWQRRDQRGGRKMRVCAAPRSVYAHAARCPGAAATPRALATFAPYIAFSFYYVFAAESVSDLLCASAAGARYKVIRARQQRQVCSPRCRAPLRAAR